MDANNSDSASLYSNNIHEKEIVQTRERVQTTQTQDLPILEVDSQYYHDERRNESLTLQQIATADQSLSQNTTIRFDPDADAVDMKPLDPKVVDGSFLLDLEDDFRSTSLQLGKGHEEVEEIQEVKEGSGLKKAIDLASVTQTDLNTVSFV